MKIKVTKPLIDGAVRRDSHHCMIADAIKTACPEAMYILVDLQSIRWSVKSKKKRYFCLTPPNAQQALIKLDQGQTVAPFAFTAVAIKTRKTNRGGKHHAKAKRTHKQPVLQKERRFGVRMLKP